MCHSGKGDDTQQEIDQDKPLLEQTFITSTLSQDNRDIALDKTLFADNLAELSN